ncbi:MAG: DHHW family protein [Faecalimonas sp.]|nr:DHHW family protein [Faecalimonas sp.]
MENKTKNIISGLVMILLFLGVSVFCVLKPTNAYSESERRRLAQFPELTADTILTGEFMTKFEEYALDQFPLREQFRALKALANRYVFGQQDNNGIYVKNGYLSKQEYPLNRDSVSYAARRLEYVYDKYLAGTDAKAYLAVIPDKNYFLEDRTQLTLDYEEMFSQIKKETAFLEYVDLVDTLSLESFYKTDTHWRQEKILPTAQKIAEQMGVSLTADYTEEMANEEFYGVYYGQAALPFAADELRYLTNRELEELRVYDYQNEKEISVYDMEKAFGRDPYEMFLAGSLSLLTLENAQATTERELVVFRDSFGSSIVPLFAEAYQKITVVDIRYIHPDQLEKFVTFTNQDVLFLYSTLVLNNSDVMK